MRDQQMLMILCAEERVEELVALLERYDVAGFTELQGLQGAGSTGKHLGTRAYPGTVSMFLTVGSGEEIARVAEGLGEFAKDCRPGQGLRAYALQASQVV